MKTKYIKGRLMGFNFNKVKCTHAAYAFIFNSFTFFIQIQAMHKLVRK